MSGLYSVYQRYADAGIDWADYLPTEWGHIKLRWGAFIYAGGTPSRTNLAFWENGTVPWLNSGSVNQGLIHEASAFITKAALQNSSARWIKTGSLVVALAGQGKTKGMAAQLDIDATCNQSMAAIVPSAKLRPRFLLWWLSSNYQNIRNMAGGDLRDGLNLQLLGDIQCPLPTQQEQTQIARFLDYETAKIDALIEKQQQLITLLKEKRQAVISHAVTKGLNPDAPLRDSGVEWLGEVPAHWEVAPLKYKCELIDGDRSSAYPGEEDLVDEGIPFVSSKNISDFRLTRRNLVCITQEKFDQLRRGKLQPDDLVITVRGTIGNVGVFYPKVMECDTAFINAQMMIMRPIAGLTAFLELVCQSFVWQEQLDLAAYGSTVRQLSNQVLGNVKIVLPPSHEVDVLVNATIEKVAKINSLVAAAQSAEGLLQERRTALISAAVTGKIDVRNWQSPDDE